MAGRVEGAEMFALTYDEYGDPSVLRVTTVPEPHAGPGEVRIAVRAAGVNPVDWKIRSGYLKDMMPVEFPAIPGSDAAGVVDEVGEGVEGVGVGDEVFGSGQGVSAEFAVLDHFTAKPAAMSWEEAAGLPVAAETAQRALDILKPSAGQTLLIEGAAGGVGSVAAQFAIADGVRVIGTASESNHDYLRSLGVIPTTYGPGLKERVAEPAPEGVDAALDTAGKGSLPDLVEITGSPGKVVTIADFEAAKYGVRVTAGMGGEPRAWHALPKAARLFEQGELRVAVDSVFPLAEAAKAHERSEGGHVSGKIILKVTQA
jgi:NADPH:quinone reductase-like Zn-dependent oxidoreductase